MRRFLRQRPIGASGLAGAIGLALVPGLAHAQVAGAAKVCAASADNAVGAAETKVSLQDGAAGTTLSTFAPFFHDTVVAAGSAKLPAKVKAGSSGDPAIGAFPAAKFFHRYVTVAENKHTLPLDRLILQVPMVLGGERRPVYFKASIGAWQGGETVSKRDISAINGLLDVPVYSAAFVITEVGGGPGKESATGLGAAVKSADHADIEIRDGSAAGPLLMSGAINLGVYHDRLVLIKATIDEAVAAAKAGRCTADG